ncbi:MAG TPA: glycosyltransferase family 9 protein, partial [Bacillota bacterium]|nr:glycosyltransferase family 9 protein [Bacillota bacterium]
RNRFSLAVDFQGYGETALFTWCSGAPQRWGNCYRPGRKWAYTRAITRDNNLHPIEGHLALLRQAGLPAGSFANQFRLPGNALESAQNLFAKLGLHLARATVFIQPFTSSPHKDWPLERYLASARHWRERGLQVLFGGGPADSAALEPARQAGFAVAAGAPLLQSAGLVSLSTVVVGGDTGLLHLAAAMDKPVVMIMGSTGPGTCVPFGNRHLAVVPPAGLPVAAVAPETVEAACARGLAQFQPA